MKIKEAINRILILKNNSEIKFELGIFDKFIQILSNIETRDLTENQINLIENNLDTTVLDLEKQDSKKVLNKIFEKFKVFLKDNFSLIIDGYYTGYGIVFGMLAGVLVQLYFGSFSMIVGMMIGLIIGVFLDKEAKKQGRVLRTKRIKSNEKDANKVE